MKVLLNRVAVISGGGSGIGRGAALALARAGMKTLIADLCAERAQETAQLVREAGGEAESVRCDVTQERDLEAMRDAAVQRFGSIDLIMNNAGVLPSGKFAQVPISEWQRAWEVNVLSYVRTIQILLPELLKSGDAHIVNTASTAGLYPYTADRLPYSSTKAALISFSECLSLDLQPQGIGITCLCPGPVKTNIVEQMKFHGEARKTKVPTLALLDPVEVGGMVVKAVRDGTFLLLTHPEVHDILRLRADNPESFLAEQIRVVNG